MRIRSIVSGRRPEAAYYCGVSAVDDEAIVGMAIVGGILLFLSLWVVVAYVTHALRIWQEISLKRDMVARGYTAREIIAVVSRRRRRKEEEMLPDVPPAKPVKHPAFG